MTLAVAMLGTGPADAAGLQQAVTRLLETVWPTPAHVVAEVLEEMLARLVDEVEQGGWGARDLDELVRRNADDRHRGTLADVLQRTVRLAGSEQLGSGLQVAALLTCAPRLQPGSFPLDAGRAPDEAEHPKLARVRALLAKAESTEFDEEAEAFSAKAQELIATYSLERLLGRGGQQRSDAGSVRRIWLDPPYVRAKATLVHSVAVANRCRSVVYERFGFSLVVGAGGDLDAVELLVTSLLVQANRAMLRHGRRTDGAGVARTRSFRQSFLLAYASRIGQRLRAATAMAVEELGEADSRLPVLRQHELRVADALAAMVPRTTKQKVTISNGAGWAAGLAAADLAQLDVNAKLSGRSG